MKQHFILFAATILAVALVCSCEKETAPVETTEEISAEVISSHIYSVSIGATERRLSTKKLDWSGNTMNAKWEEGEIVNVFGTTLEDGQYKPSESVSLGTLKAVESGGKVVLSGDIDFAPYDTEIAGWNIEGVTDVKSLIDKGVSPQVYLFYPDYPFSFAGQTGEFDVLSRDYDKAWARMFVRELNDSTATLVNTKFEEKAQFYNPASIFQFTFKDRDNNEIIPKTVTISGSELYSKFS